MKILIICETTLENGRGPVYRLINVLPKLAKWSSVIFVSLGDSDDISKSVIQQNCQKVYNVEIDFEGWFVKNKSEIANQVMNVVKVHSPDVVVLYWEIWDLMKEISLSMASFNIPFAVILHSIPFVDAFPKPSHFLYIDIIRRLLREKNWFVIKFILLRMYQIPRVMRQFEIVSINETVNKYMNLYFPKLEFTSAIPGYALELELIKNSQKSNKDYDFIFMAKLVDGKGIYELPKIMTLITIYKKDATLLVMGSFETNRDENQFIRIIHKLNLEKNIEMAGWVQGQRKYELLKSGRIFLYPSISADTFSFCLLEALACGLPAICYDVPFIKAIYKTDAVLSVPYLNNKEFANTALELLKNQSYLELANSAHKFVEKYSSWEDVAKAELKCYQNIIDKF